MNLDMPATDSESLLSEASSILVDLRDSFARVLGTLPTPVRRPRDLTKALGVQQTLAWKIMRVVDSKDPFATVQYIPGVEGVNIFLKAARGKEAPQDVIDRAQQAMKSYRRLIDDHAGSRAALELMLGASARETNQHTDLTYRKAGFQCSSYTWGVQARVRLLSTMLYPGDEPHTVRLANVAGYVGLRRVRPQIRWTLWQTACGVYSEDSEYQHAPYLPIDPDGVLPSGVPLLKDFCSAPPGQIVRIALPGGGMEDQWVDGQVGDKAAITCIEGAIANTIFPLYGDDKNPYHEFGLPVRTPVELLINDVFIHRDILPGVQPFLTVYSELGGCTWNTIAQVDRMPHHALDFPESVEHLGRGRSAIHTVKIPRYTDMMCFAFRKLGWDIDACEVYRVEMQYPVMGTAAVIQFDARAPKTTVMKESDSQPR